MRYSNKKYKIKGGAILYFSTELIFVNTFIFTVAYHYSMLLHNIIMER